MTQLKSSSQESFTTLTAGGAGGSSSAKTVFEWVSADYRGAVKGGTVYTSASDAPVISEPTIAPAPEQVYPHLFDPQGAAGEALSIVEGALQDARSALKAFGESDLETVASRLMQIAAAMQTAHKLTSFNEDFGAVISFIRRATLGADAAEVTREMLNVLIHVLNSLKKAPAIDLEDAGNLVDRLDDAGWQGEHPGVDALMAVLFPDETAEQADNAVAAATQT